MGYPTYLICPLPPTPPTKHTTPTHAPTRSTLAATWASSVALAIYSTRDTSGAHLNPAVTMAMLAVKRDISAVDAGAYISSQVFGAFVASASLYAVFCNGIVAMEKKSNISRGSVASKSSYAGAFGMVPNPTLVRSTLRASACEGLQTGILVAMVMGITDSEKSVPPSAQPILIGTTVGTLIATFGPVTQCGMNPARDLGPRLVTLCTGWGSAALYRCCVRTARRHQSPHSNAISRTLPFPAELRQLLCRRPA